MADIFAMDDIFHTYCSVCDKQLSSTHGIYCSEQCKTKDSSASHTHTRCHHAAAHGGACSQCRLYPSVLDYYMDDAPPTPRSSVPDLASSESDDDLSDFSLPNSPGAYRAVAASALKMAGIWVRP